MYHDNTSITITKTQCPTQLAQQSAGKAFYAVEYIWEIAGLMI